MTGLAIIMDTRDDCGPCGCVLERATWDLEIPRQWFGDERQEVTPILATYDLQWILDKNSPGYDYASILGDDPDDPFVYRSLCRGCAQDLLKTGLAKREINTSLC